MFIKGPISELRLNFTLKLKNYSFGPERLAVANSSLFWPSKITQYTSIPQNQTGFYPKPSGDAYYYDMNTGILVYKKIGDAFPVDTIQRQLFHMIEHDWSYMLIADTNIDFSIPSIGGRGDFQFNFLIPAIILSLMFSVLYFLSKRKKLNRTKK